jgi:hypothetical protein
VHSRFVIILAAALLAGGAGLLSAEQPTSRASVDSLEADLRFLADDLLEGREAGTRGYDLAALYVAQRFRALGLQPGGEEAGYFQAVPMLEYAPGPQSEVSIGDIDLVAGEDYLVSPTSKGESIDISAPLIFGGMCFASEREGRDDFEGIDLSGKIVACMRGAPKYLNSEERAHYGATQAERISERGAIGVIVVYTPSFEKVLPFERLARMLDASFSRMTWLEDDGTPYSPAPNVQAAAILSLAGAEKLFRGTGQPWDEILEAAESEQGDVRPTDLGVDARLRIGSRHRNVTSHNVVGIVPGSDEDLADEYVVLMAHLDHVGIKPTEEADDDEIYNGAMDNASGISALLEVARLLRDAPPKRSVLFIALTAEEKGLNGSDYFARNPTVPRDRMVAAVNLDMPILTYDFTDIVAFGAERSTLYEPVREAAEAHGLMLSPDPMPDEGIFTRSDHYNFVKQGVPSVYLKPGFANGGEQAQNEFRTTHYHEASDEVDLVNLDALRRFTEVKADIARNIANLPERPVWNPGDFFGETFDGPMANE